MTEQEIEKDADEAWMLWRRKMREAGVKVEKLGEIEQWHHAYRMGMALGAELERAACVSLLEYEQTHALDAERTAHREEACIYLMGLLRDIPPAA